MISFARSWWSSFYSDIPDGFKRLAVAGSALVGIDFFLLFNVENGSSKFFADFSLLEKIFLAGIVMVFAWFFAIAVGWLWSTRKLPYAIRWGAVLVSFGPVIYSILNHSDRAIRGQSYASFGLIGFGLALPGFACFVLALILTIFSWIAAGGFSRSNSNAKNNGAQSGQAQRFENDLDYHYAVLGVNRGSSIEDIKKAYREKMKQYHPDKVANLGAKLRRVAEEESKAITSAYSIIIEERSC